MPAVLQDHLPGLGEIHRIVQPTDAGETIQDRFEAFHALNPWVCAELERMTADCIGARFSKIGIGMLFEIVRYRYGRATVGDDFRLNNDFRSRYVRLLLQQHPEWTRYFEVRALRSD